MKLTEFGNARILLDGVPNMTKLDPEVVSAIRDRVHLIRDWLAEQARTCVVDQKDFQISTAESVYWQFGYEAALQDILDCVGPLPELASNATR